MTRAFKRGGVWYIDYIDSTGKRQRPKTNCQTKASAEKLAAELQMRADRARMGLGEEKANPDNLTVKAAAQWWIDHVLSDRSKRQTKPSVVRHIRDHEIGKLRLEQLTPGLIAHHLEKIAKATSPANANHIHAYISGIYSEMERLGKWCGAHPIHRKVRKFKTEKPTPNPWPAWCIPILIRNAPTVGWKIGIALAAYTGMRRIEIEELTSGAVHLSARIIDVGRTKSGAARRVAIHPVLAELLKEHKSVGVVAKADWNNSATTLRTIARRAVIPADIYEKHNWHDLRDTWASQMVECGAREGVVQYMGWGKGGGSVMRTTYLEYPAARLREEIDKLSYPTKSADIIQIKERA